VKFDVFLLPEAGGDLVAIHRYVSRKHSTRRADALLIKLERACATLARFPLRGHVPFELERIAILDFGEIVIRPHRIVYQIDGARVDVHAVLDGRRELQDLLAERMLR
jgi:toxin ParE1/3/4